MVHFHVIVFSPRPARGWLLVSLWWSAGTTGLEVHERVTHVLQVEVVVGEIHGLFLVDIARSTAGNHRQIMLRSKHLTLRQTLCIVALFWIFEYVASFSR